MRLEREVTELQRQVAAKPAPLPSDAQAPSDADNPAYVQIQAQIVATRNELAALAGEMAKLRTQSADYQRNISLSPQVEKEYRELSRDYDNARLKYAEVRSKQQEAKTAQNLEADRKGEKFTLIDPPLPPEEPVSPNRTLIFVTGLVLSLALTFGVLWFLETMDTTIRGRKDLFDLTGIPPLALVPHIGTVAEAQAARRRKWYAIGTSFATVCVAVVLIHFFFMPLDVLWFTFARRFGL
jgi:polysaccharide biosynthesis transport protein